MERAHIELRLEGMQLHMQQALLLEFDKIKEETSIALKRAIHSFDYSTFVEQSVNKWLEDMINETMQSVISNPAMDISNELEIRITVTYFKKANGEKIIALSEYYEGGDCDNYKMTLYTYEQNEWINITKEILPDISFDDFWGNETPPAVEEYLSMNSNINFNYELPQFGTTIQVYPVGLGALICFSNNAQDYEKWLDLYNEALTNRTHESIEIKWNREKGIFTLSLY